MATKADLIARISAEVQIISDTLLNEAQNLRAYRIRHQQTVGVNAVGAEIMLWVYDEGGAAEQAYMSYTDWLDIPLSNRYADYRATLPATTDTTLARYHSLHIMEFQQDDGTEEKSLIGIWNPATDKLDVYDSAIVPPPDSGINLPLGYVAFGYGARNASVVIDPQDGQENAIKLPLFDTKGIEQPQGINFIDVADSAIVIPEGIEAVRVDVTIPIVIAGADQAQGTNFFFQWQNNGSWAGAPRETGYQRGDLFHFSLSPSLIFEDAEVGETRFTLWCWTEGRQGVVTLGEVDCIVEERKYDARYVRS